MTIIPPVIWSAPPQTLALSDDEIHVWRASLDVDSRIVRSLQGSLTSDEQSRAGRFVFPRDRDHFVTCRGILRQIIGAYLRCTSSQIEFQYGAHGKPSVHVDESQSLFHFNLSHSDGLAVYAFSRQREVGIDAELIRPNFEGEEIAKRYFSSAELSEWYGLAAESRAEAFFLGWTRKEAYMKARGLGMQIALDSFSVSLTPRGPERLNSEDSWRWRIVSFEPAPQFVAAVVGEGKDWQPRYLSWSPPKAQLVTPFDGKIG